VTGVPVTAKMARLGLKLGPRIVTRLDPSAESSGETRSSFGQTMSHDGSPKNVCSSNHSTGAPPPTSYKKMPPSLRRITRELLIHAGSEKFSWEGASVVSWFGAEYLAPTASCQRST